MPHSALWNAAEVAELSNRNLMTVYTELSAQYVALVQADNDDDALGRAEVELGTVSAEVERRLDAGHPAGAPARSSSQAGLSSFGGGGR